MSYITVDHPAGAVRYVYDPETDAVLRVTIVRIEASSTDPATSSTYANADWIILYHVPVPGTKQTNAYRGEQLHSTPDRAFRYGDELKADKANAARDASTAAADAA